jgi:WD40 repeat protein
LFFAANASSNRVYSFQRPFTNWTGDFGPHRGVDMLAVTQDGRRVATGSSTGRDAKVWDATTGTERLAVPLSGRSTIGLSPDGRWLLIHGDGVELWDLQTGQPAPPFPFSEGQPLTGAACFSSDSRILAMVLDQYEIELFDLASWNPLGRLRGPADHRMTALAFNGDGSAIAAGVAQGRLRVWNLARMRQRLAEADLDWEDAPFPKDLGVRPRQGLSGE